MIEKPSQSRKEVIIGASQFESGSDTALNPLVNQLVRALEFSSDTILLADAAATVLYVNHTTLAQSGYAKEDVIGHPMTFLWHEPNEYTRHILAELAANRPWRGRIQHQSKRAHFYYESVTINPVVDNSGAVTHFFKVGKPLDPVTRPDDAGEFEKSYHRILDLTRELKENEESYHRVMELAPDAITITRLSDGKYLEVNETFCLQTGYARDEVIGRTVSDLNIYVNMEDRNKIVHALRTEGCVSGLRVTFRHRDGSPLHDIVSGRIIKFKGEDCLLFVATLINSLIEIQNALEESEKRYRNILEAAPDAICLTRLEDGKYIEANNTFYARTGYTREETIGRTVQDLEIYADPADRSRFIGGLRENGQVDGMEILTRYKDGTLSHQLWAGRIIEYDGVECLLVVAKRIDDLKKIQWQLMESEARFREIFDTAADAIFVTDAEDGRFLDVNPAACRHLGYVEKELREMALGNVVDPQYPYRKPLPGAEPDQAGRVFFESFHICKDGHSIPVEVSSRLIVRSGRSALLSIVRDISERKQAEAELARYRQHLEEMVRDRTRELEEAQNELVKREKLSVLGQLTATVSHELRNPLGVIRSSSFYVKRKIQTPDEKVAKHIKRIEDQVDICDTIVADLLEYTRGGAVLIELQDVKMWMTRAVEQTMEAEGFQIEMNIQKKLPLVLHDQEKMRRVLINLLSNAIQAVRAREEAEKSNNQVYQPVVRLNVSRCEDGIAIAVADNGIGMDPETRQHAFEPLFTTRARGTGIGLAIVSKVVTEHNGRIYLESKPMDGTKITFTLPGKRNDKEK